MTHSSLLISALAHIGLLILSVVGLPALHDAPDPLEVPIPVTVTMVSERTEAKGPLPPVEPSPPDTAPEPEPAVAEPPPVETPSEPEPAVAEPPPVETPPAEPVPQEEPVQVAALAPEPPKPQPLPEPEPAPSVAPLPPSPPEPEKAPPASDPKPPPLPQRPPQQQARAKPAAKPPEPQPAPEPAPEPPPLPQAAPEDPPDELKALRQAALPNDLDTLRSAVSDDTAPAREEAEEPVFTISEKHRLFRQLSRCWQTIPGLAPAERHIVVLQVALGSDRRVTSIKAVDGKGSRSYRAAQERAERALRHPFCEQLDVPPGKMGLWKSLTLRFDPHRMQ